MKCQPSWLTNIIRWDWKDSCFYSHTGYPGSLEGWATVSFSAWVLGDSCLFIQREIISSRFDCAMTEQQWGSHVMNISVTNSCNCLRCVVVRCEIKCHMWRFSTYLLIVTSSILLFRFVFLIFSTKLLSFRVPPLNRYHATLENDNPICFVTVAKICETD